MIQRMLAIFNLYAEYIMRNAGLEETQAGIKIAGRNINHLRYADDTTLMAESEEELKSLLMKVKEESEKVGLKLNIGIQSHHFQNFPEFSLIHTVKGFGIVNKAEINVFLELSCFFHDPVDVGNLISGSSAFSKTSLNIRKFTVHILLKPGLENFEHYFTSM